MGRHTAALIAATAIVVGVPAEPAFSNEPLPGLGPALAAASNFGHGAQEDVFRQALDLGVRDFRDIIYWSAVETEAGTYAFDSPTTVYPKAIAAAGATMSLTVNWGNPLYDEGATPHSPSARAALARFVDATLDAYPAITAVEVGNEFNGQQFIRGPILKAKRAARAEPHLHLLEAIDAEIATRHPKVEILGGAAHSVPLGYLWPLLDLGGATHMDALTLHPYTTEPEQFVRQIAVLRRHPVAQELPLQVTEFGTDDPSIAPGFLLRMYCVMAQAGVERAAWYPLNERGDGMTPLLDGELLIPTATGRAFALAQDWFAGRTVEMVRPDPYTYGCRFDESVLLLWGEPRGVIVDETIDAKGPDGVRLDLASLRLSLDRPIILRADGPITVGENVQLDTTDIVADSFHQFAYPEEGQARVPEDPFERFARRGDRRVNLQTMPGQNASGTPWTPYLGNRYILPARLEADTLVPGGTSENPVEIVHRYHAPRDISLNIETRWSPSDRSEDGVVVSVWKGEKLHYREKITEATDLSLPSLLLKSGDRLDFVVGPGATARGDVTAYRIVLREIDDG